MNLVQLTVKASITAYVNLELAVKTEERHVNIILGTDFADQYALSLLRRDGRHLVRFGESERQIELKSSMHSGPSREWQCELLRH